MEKMNRRYAYEPDYADPRQELAACLLLYRTMIADLHKYSYDDMEVVARLHDRDGIAWALDQLDGQVPPAILQEIIQLDARLQQEAPYLVRVLDIYGAIGRDQPKSYWWWYLDELISTKGAHDETVAATPTRAPAIALREEEAKYVAPEHGQGRGGNSDEEVR
jgi:hypothetical protein